MCQALFKDFRYISYTGILCMLTTLGDGEGQGNLVCCSPWGRKELYKTKRLKNNNKYVLTLHNKVTSK